LEVSELSAILPGVRVHASGQGTKDRISASGDLTASDLAELSRAIAAVAGKDAPRLSGAGRLRISAMGPLKRLSVSADGQFSRVSYQDLAAGELKISATVPDLKKPLTSQASITAATLQVGDKLFKNLSAQLMAEGRDWKAQLRTSRFAD